MVNMLIRDCSRLFDQVGHQTTNASLEISIFSLNNVCQTYQNFEQSWQKLSTFLGNKVLKKSKFSKNFINKSWSPTGCLYAKRDVLNCWCDLAFEFLVI